MNVALTSRWIPRTGVEWLEQLRQRHLDLVARRDVALAGPDDLRRRHDRENAQFEEAMRRAQHDPRAHMPHRPVSHRPEARHAELTAASERLIEAREELGRFVCLAVAAIREGADELWEIASRTSTGASWWLVESRAVKQLLRDVSYPDVVVEEVLAQSGLAAAPAAASGELQDHVAAALAVAVTNDAAVAA